MDLQFDALMESGIEIMLVGMGSVFIYLGFLVFVIAGMSKLAHAIGPAAEPMPESAPNVSPNAASAAESGDIPAVISAAVHQYRADKN